MHKKKVLVVAPGKETRGGITSVILAYEQSYIWNKWNCVWVETYIDKSAIFKIFYFFNGLWKFIINISSSNIVHIHLSESTSAIRKAFFFYVAYFMRKKTILHFHAFSPDTTIYGKRKSLYRSLFIKSDKVIVLSQFWQKEIDSAFGSNTVKSVVLFNPCTTINHPNDKIAKEKIILFAGTLNDRKGFVDLIQAFAIVKKQYPDWKLVLAGNGEIERGKTIVAELGITADVIFTGWVSGIDKETIFKKSSIFCLPSYNEGFPMAILDALACGLPVITTPVGGILDVFIDGKNAFIFNPGDIKTLAQKLIILIENEAIRNQFIEASNKLAATTFSLNNISKQLDILYSELI